MKSIFTFLSIFLSINVFAQTNQSVIVEHFTNTNCSVCGSRNPGLHSNLANNNPEVIHISYHPSRPYNDCKLNNHNGTENDDRTKYYGIYGSTPQIVIQGETKPRANFNNADLFDDYKGVEASYLSETTYEMGVDSMYVMVVLKSNSTTDWTDLNVVVMAIEDTVNYKGRNSERVHYNVFRRSFTGVEGQEIGNLIELGDSVVYYFSLPIHQDWDVDQMSTISIIQNKSDKSIANAEKGTAGTVQRPVGLKNESRSEVSIFPTIVDDQLNVSTTDYESYEIIGLDGKVLMKGIFTNKIEVGALEKGLYIFRLRDEESFVSSRFIKR
jgi:hypothetical protein